MFSKIYAKIKYYIKQNYKFILLLIALFFVFTFELPYYIDAPGGLIEVSSRIEVEDSSDSSGTFNLAYISEFKATIPTLIFAYFNDDWDIIKNEEIVASNETVQEIEYRNHLLLEEANQNAVIVAFEKANIDYEVKSRTVNIIYIYEGADTDLKIGDEIIEVNGQKVNNKEEVLALIEQDDSIKFKVMNDGKEYYRYANKKNINGEYLVGIMICETKEVVPSKEVSFNFNKSESGPSGGFMMALAIYDFLIPEDLTNGLKIVGTGTIDENGNVGAIGGVEYKLKAAEKEKADIFFVPKANFEEAKQAIEENELNINLVVVSHIDEAITYLRNYR